MTASISMLSNGVNTVRNISLIQRSLNRSMQRLSSGLQINEAADDPAGLVISERMRSQIGSITKQIGNLEYNLNRNNAADSIVGELSDKLQEIRSVAVAAANESDPTSETGKVYQQQLDDLVASYNRTAQDASYGESKMFVGDHPVVKLTEISGLNVANPEDATSAIDTVDKYLEGLQTAHETIGSRSKNEYQSTIRSLQVTSQNLTAAEASIRDVDYAREQAIYMKQMLMLNSNVAVMTQGNLASDAVFKLLHA